MQKNDGFWVKSCCFERALGVKSSWFSWLISVLVYPRVGRFRMKRLLSSKVLA